MGKGSTDASNDLERATSLARRMVTAFGMTEALGPVRYQTAAGTGNWGTPDALRQDISPETATLIDKETRSLVEAAQAHVLALLSDSRSMLDEVARILIEREVIDGDEIRRIAHPSPRA